MQFIKAKNLANYIKIKPCPFCGETEEIAVEEYEHGAGLRWRIFCCNCMAGIDRGYDQSPYPLIDLWNTRAYTGI